MKQVLRRASAALNPVRARAKVLSRENREMRLKLVAVRRAASLTQQDVADLMGISQQAVNKLERYDADPRLSTLERYANAVGALISHRVEVDRGQSRHLAGSPWGDSGTSTRRVIHPVSTSAGRAIEGWHLAAHVEPVELVAR